MIVEEIGAWVLLVLGGLAFLAAIVKVFLKPPRSLLPWIFGLLAMGLSVFGLAFFQPYTSFLKVLNVAENPGEESYVAFMKSVGQGDVREDYAKVGMAFMLANPVEGMEGVVQSAVQTAVDPAGGMLLQEAQATLESRAVVAEALTQERITNLDLDTVRSADEFTARSVGRTLESLDSAELVRRGFDPVHVEAEVKDLPPP
jgi:hypothetical protein